jgi:hypothetical protein
MRAVLAIVLTATTAAHADGVYFNQMIGAGQSDSPLIGKTVQTRAGVGARIDSLAIEAWSASDSAPDRRDALFGMIGGVPSHLTDLASYGVSLKTIIPIHHTEKVRFEGYTRLSAGIVEASGRLEGYGGRMVSAGGGFQVTGRVRALGFVWGPLFFLKRGPFVTGALFVDYGYERMTLEHGDRSLSPRSNHLVMGFAIGNAF